MLMRRRMFMVVLSIQFLAARAKTTLVASCGAFQQHQCQFPSINTPTCKRRISMGSVISRAIGSSSSFGSDEYRYGTHQSGYIPIKRTSGSSLKKTKTFQLYYRIYSPQHIENAEKPPLLVLHGGPSLPSQYLYPLVPLLKNDSRSVIFYDQLGCGRSNEPKDTSMYSIPLFVDDIATVVEALGVKRMHVYGHSFGGVLAFEYVKKCHENVASLVLSNAATNMKVSSDDYDRLHNENPKKFWSTHACRTESMPPALQDAFAHVGRVFVGMDAVMDYVAEKPITNDMRMPPTLVVQGRHDFGLQASMGWSDLLGKQNNNVVETIMLENCAHYPHFEDPEAYGKLIQEFLSRHDDVAA